jgi:hypothetical protein
MAASTSSTFGPVRESFRAVAMTVVPEAASLQAGEWEELERIVERGLASRPAAIRRQLRLFVRILEILPLFRFGKTFRRLDPDQRTRFLLTIQDAPLLLLRRGFWGVRTLVYMGYYSRPAAREEIGYRATTAGWEGRL